MSHCKNHSESVADMQCVHRLFQESAYEKRREHLEWTCAILERFGLTCVGMKKMTSELDSQAAIKWVHVVY